MYPRTNYEMTEADLAAILDACKSTPVMMIGSYTSSSPQENANDAWAALGRKMGFDHMTVQPVQGKGNRFFTAVPSETEQQRTERVAREKEESRKVEIARLTDGIAEFQQKLADLQKGG
jgi:nitrogen regulatory protein PII